MKIVANDGREFRTVEEALEYEKKLEEPIREIQQLAQKLNDKMADLGKNGWSFSYKIVDDQLSIIARKDEYHKTVKSFNDFLEELCR